jgi:GTPase SAR1 family protein
MTAVTQGLESLTPRVQHHLDEVVRQLHKGGCSELVARLRETVEARRAATPSVVVVGETKRGKSSLVNALLHRRGLSPVGVDVTTGCVLVFHSAPQERVQVRLAADGSLQPIAGDEIAEWASVDGNPDNVRGVHAVLVGTPDPLLAQFTLVDTPGAGGLEAGHGVLAQQAANGADALVFVLDASAPVSEGEIRFLSDVAESVDNIVVVLTKVDQHRGWETIAAGDAEVLGRRIDRLAGVPILPVANPLAVGGDAELLAESGIPEVQRRLTEIVAGHAEQLRFANILRLARSCLDELERSLATQLVYVTDSKGALRALEAERARLGELGADPRALVAELDKNLRRLSLDRSDALNRGMRDLRLAYDEKSATVSRDELALLPGQLLADVTALADRLAEEASSRIVSCVEALISRVDAQVPELESLVQLRSPNLESGVSLSTPTGRGSTRVEKLSTMISFSSGRSIGSVVASLPVFAIAGVPFLIAGLGVGAAFAWHMHRGRGDVNRATEFKTWMREQLAEAERQLNNDFSRAMIDVADETRAGLGERIDDRRREVESEIAKCEAALAREHSAAAAERTRLEAMLEQIRELDAGGAALRAELLAAG